MGADEGQTSTELTKEIDITTDGEYGDHDEVKVVMTTSQLSKLAELLDLHIDPDVVRFDNNDPEGYACAQIFLAAAREALGTTA